MAARAISGPLMPAVLGRDGATALVLLALVVGASVAPASAEPSRVGLLGPSEPRFDEIAAGLRQGLREQGYAEGSVEILESRVTRGDRAGARAAVEELHRQEARVLFTIGSELARQARAAAEIPIVFLTPGDPVASGLVESLSRPGGRLTGMTFEYPELSGKRLELLRELAPQARRVLVVYDPRDASPRQGVAAAREAAARLGLVLVEREARRAEEVEPALAALASTDALLVVPGGVTSGHHQAMVRAAHATRRPTVVAARTAATAAALLGYGASDVEVARQAARLVDRILRGARAGDLPVERPDRIELTVSLRAARELGLVVPPSILLRADRVLD